jgi:hypothetical protein
MSLEQDSATIESLLSAVYDALSGKRPNWDRLTPLFHPDARLIPPARENNPVIAITFAQYRERTEKNLGSLTPDQGFYERGIAHIIETFVNIAHVWSTYEARRKPDDAHPFTRGINSFQFVRQDNRWWVLTILWDSERADNPIPKNYLG